MLEIDDLKPLFDKHQDELFKFDRIKNPLANRKDLHVFLLMDTLLPATGHNIIRSAEHDEIWLEIDEERLVEVITENHIVDLIRCGVMYESGVGFSMFV